MTVKELKDVLSRFPENARVFGGENVDEINIYDSIKLIGQVDVKIGNVLSLEIKEGGKIDGDQI